jgi:hypothetical protein
MKSRRSTIESKGWMQRLTGRIAALTALLVAVAALMAAVISITERSPPLCSLGISLPWCKAISAAHEREPLQHLMSFLCGRGVLQNDYSWELPGEVYASVIDIRTELEKTLDQLATDSAARQPLQKMQEASRMLLQDPTVFPAGGGARPISGPLRDAIHKFRTVFSQNTSQIVQTYKLTGNCDLSAGLDK